MTLQVWHGHAAPTRQDVRSSIRLSIETRRDVDYGGGMIVDAFSFEFGFGLIVVWIVIVVLVVAVVDVEEGAFFRCFGGGGVAYWPAVG